MSEGKEVVSWDEEMAKYAQKVAASERPNLASISLKGGIMSYEKTPIPGNKLLTIVIASMMENRFYKDRYDPNKPASPVCFAFHDGSDAEPWIPHPASHEIQSADGCATCPRMQWGSDLNGGRGKACKQVRKLALMPKIDSKEMALLSIPVMSVKNWSNYVNGLAATIKRPPWGVVTEISVHPDPRSQFVVKFDVVELVPEDKLPQIFSQIKMANNVLSAPYDYADPGETAADNSATSKKAKKY
jgi:hypothetical protein